MGVLNQGLSIMGVDAAWVKTIKGLVVIAAVATTCSPRKRKAELNLAPGPPGGHGDGPEFHSSSERDAVARSVPFPFVAMDGSRCTFFAKSALTWGVFRQYDSAMCSADMCGQ